jgi:hypothetical protein
METSERIVASEADARFLRLVARVDSGLPEGLRRPLLEYLGYLVLKQAHFVDKSGNFTRKASVLPSETNHQ